MSNPQLINDTSLLPSSVGGAPVAPPVVAQALPVQVPAPAPVDPVTQVAAAVDNTIQKAETVATNPAIAPLLAQVQTTTSGIPKKVRAWFHSASIFLGAGGTIASVLAGQFTGQTSLDIAAIGGVLLAVEGAISLSKLSD